MDVFTYRFSRICNKTTLEFVNRRCILIGTLVRSKGGADDGMAHLVSVGTNWTVRCISSNNT